MNRRAALLGCVLLATGCATPAPQRQPAPRPVPVPVPEEIVPLGEAAFDSAPEPDEVPAEVAEMPDAVPRAERRSASGNARQYEVFGRTYRVLDSAQGFKERGIASWYGKRFHGRKTANGEAYDMYAMSAAHKSLPLPSYVRVTHLANGRSVIVRVNDRGPFYPGRIIDLSYAAAAKLGIIGSGHGKVEIEAVQPRPTPAPQRDEGYVQVAAYEDPISAISMREEISRLGLGEVQVWTSEGSSDLLHRVVVGPYPNQAAAQDVLGNLRARGLDPGWVLR